MTQIIRERLAQVSALLPGLEVALFTSFNFNTSFFEQNVLPALFDCEPSATQTKKDCLLNRELQRVAVGVVCDPGFINTSARPYRYTVYPAFIKSRFFHPKNIILIGKDANDKRWLYIACMSANLTLAGWGSNCESFADTWTHAQEDQPWQATKGFLDYLSAIVKPPRGRHALASALALLDEMPVQSKLANPEGEAISKTLSVYFSPLHNSAWTFVRKHYGAINGLRAGSPYWGDIASVKKGLPDDAWLQLVAARLPLDFAKTGLSAESADGLDPESLRLWKTDSRFFHAKVIQIATDNGTVRGMGSCNFTWRGLNWSGDEGNVECMMFDYGNVVWPDTEALPPSVLALESDLDKPEPLSFFVAVTYDWQRQQYDWRCEGDIPPDTQLTLSGLEEKVHLSTKLAGKCRAHMDHPVFRLDWPVDRQHTGPVTEVNLQASDLVYLKRLTAQSILDSWGRGAVSEPVAADPETDEFDPENPESGKAKAAKKANLPANMNFNYFQFYRTLSTIRKKLEAMPDKAHAERFDLLVARTDSVCSLADSVMEEAFADTTRLVVHVECLALLGAKSGPALGRRKSMLRTRVKELRARVTAVIATELKLSGHKESMAPDMLDWYLGELRA